MGKQNKKGASNAQEKPKTKRKRDSRKYPGLDKRLFSRIKQEYFDLDYIRDLSDEESAWLNQFMEEYLGARLNGSEKPLHKNKALRKDCFDRNNQRNRDVYNNKKILGGLQYGHLPEDKSTDNPEDALIDYIDTKKETE